MGLRCRTGTAGSITPSTITCGDFARSPKNERRSSTGRLQKLFVCLGCS
jgi:hypothetical protein